MEKILTTNTTNEVAKYIILEDTAKNAINIAAKGDVSEAVELVENVFKRFNVPFLESCVMQIILKGIDRTEKDIYSLFERNYQYILGGNYKIVKIKNDTCHKPDFWLKTNFETIPVEIKLHNFDKKALQQLLRYINFYNCKHGIAVGEKLTAELPDNISFISIDSLNSIERA